MADGVLTIIDGAPLRQADSSLPPPPPQGTTVSGAELLELAETRASPSLFGVALPESLKSAALRRIGVSDAISEFRAKEFGYSDASTTLRSYISAIADELRDDPIVVAILDGRTLQMFLEDEDDFAMLAENLFTDLDKEDKGKISKDEIQSALVQMGVESGVPPMSEFPQLRDILNKYGAEGKEELGQAQFAQLLQPVLQELADSLAKKHVVVVQQIKVVNGSTLRKFIVDETRLNDAVQKIMQENNESKQSGTGKVRCFLEKHGDEFGFPPLELDETVDLFDEIFTEVESLNVDAGSDRDGTTVLLKDVLKKFVEKLDANPVLYDLQSSQSKQV